MNIIIIIIIISSSIIINIVYYYCMIITIVSTPALRGARLREGRRRQLPRGLPDRGQFIVNGDV